MKKIVILGGNGQVGHELFRVGWPQEFEVLCFGRDQVDITHHESVLGLLTAQPSIIINAAAYTEVDKAEDETELAFAVNCDGIANLAKECRTAEIPLIHISTDYVFDGTSDVPYREEDLVSPLGVYGRSKEAGEAILRQTLEKHIILRTSWVYASHGQNFVRTMLRLGGKRDELGIVADQIGSPTSASNIAAAIATIAMQLLRTPYCEINGECWGTFHFTDLGEASWYDFAAEILSQASHKTGGTYSHLKKLTSEEYPQKARRPRNSRLNCTKVEAVYGVERVAYQQALTSVLDEILKTR